MTRYPLALLLAWLFAAAPVSAVPLNDTGIDFCGDDGANTANCATVAADGGTHPRQDARFGRDAAAAAGQLSKVGAGAKGFDFSKIANNGSVLPATAALGSGASDWACSRDNVTGLIWEVKTTDGGLRDQRWTYSWYDSVNLYGGNAGTANNGTCYQAGRCDTEKYAADVRATALCGYSDWRMPTVKELESIVDFGRFNPAIDPTYFPNTPSSLFWSGSPAGTYSYYAWMVSFHSGDAYRDARDLVRNVSLVRGLPF